jgi:hypothetical protein
VTGVWIKRCIICKKVIWDTYTIHHYYEEKELEECKKYYFIFDNDKPSLESRFEKIQRRLSDPYSL